MARFLAYLLMLGYAFAQLPASAQPAETETPLRFYDVEIVIFKNLNVPGSHEFNLPTPSASRAPNTLDLASPASIARAAKVGFTPLPSAELQLMDSVKSIVRSSRYELLVHTGWRQPGLDESKSIPVWVRGGTVFDSTYSSIDQVTETPAASSGSRRASLPSDLLYELEGQITVTLSRYLHTRAELVLRKPAQPGNLLILNEDPAGQPNGQDDLALEGRLLLNYALNEQRRMRSRKLHYLDHPEFGMLVLITPFESAADEDIEPSEDEPPPPEETTSTGPSQG